MSILIKSLYEESDLEQKCLLIAQDIKCRRFTILQLIEELEELLLNTAISKRKEGLQILTEVIQNLPVDFVGAQELKTLSVFYTGKLTDHHQVLPVVLKGILIIIGLNNFPEEAIPFIINTLFANVSCQQQQQDDRHTIYQIFQVLVDKYKQVLIAMELHFVYGVISSIDGERDPRNLLFLFQWLKTFLNSVSLHHLTEEMFDVLACYFPIDFKASSSSMRNITREDLATELSSCLCAIPEFAEYSIPLALEKLESSLQIAKMDALKLLRDGCMVFSPSSYYTHSTEILFQLQKEVFSDKDNIIKIDCLNTLTAVINKVSQCEENYDYAALNNIVTTLKGNLLPNSKLFQPSVDILLHIAAASEQSSIYVLKKIVPLLVNTYSILSNSSEKVIILKALTQFIKAHIRYGNNLSKSDEFSTVSMICLKACTEIDEELRSTGFDSIANLAELLPEDTRIVLYKCLQNIIMKPEPAYVRVSILKCLKTFSNHYPAEINNNVLQKAKIGDKTSLNLYLNSICSIAGIKYFRDIVTDSLINYDVCDIELSIVSLKNMEQLLKETYDVELLQVLLQKQAVNKLVEYALKTMHYDNDYTELLVYISNVLKMVIGPQDYEIQSNLINYQTNRIDSCRERSEELYMFLMDGLTSRVRKGLSPDCKIIVLFTKISITNSNSLIRDVSVQLLANLINKYPEGDNFIKCLDEIKENCLIYINMYKPNVILVISWIIKALVMRNHPEASFWIDLLLNHLKHDCSVAKGFKIIMNDTYKSLSTISYCNKTLLYQQKFFVMVTDRLCERYNPENVSYLFSIGYLLEYVPEQALLLQFKKILKLIILCMEQCNDPEVLCIILNRVKNFILNNEPAVQDNLEDFLSRILKLTSFETSMNVRIAALQCLTHISSLPLYRILPFKYKVINQLGFCVDDKKRLVRKQASEARLLWCLLEASL